MRRVPTFNKTTNAPTKDALTNVKTNSPVKPVPCNILGSNRLALTSEELTTTIVMPLNQITFMLSTKESAVPPLNHKFAFNLTVLTATLALLRRPI